MSTYSLSNNWDKIPAAEIDSFMKAINNISKFATKEDMTEIEEFLWSIGYPIIYGAVGYYDEYIAETSEKMEEVEEYMFSHD